MLAHDQVFLNSTSDLRLLPAVLAAAEAAGAGAGPPTDDEMAADAARLDVAPLFDGEELERIDPSPPQEGATVASSWSRSMDDRPGSPGPGPAPGAPRP